MEETRAKWNRARSGLGGEKGPSIGASPPWIWMCLMLSPRLKAIMSPSFVSVSLLLGIKRNREVEEEWVAVFSCSSSLPFSYSSSGWINWFHSQLWKDNPDHTTSNFPSILTKRKFPDSEWFVHTHTTQIVKRTKCAWSLLAWLLYVPWRGHTVQETQSSTFREV